MTRATLVELSAGVATEEACRTLCCSTPACNHYSYFTMESSPLSEACVLLSRCTGRRTDLSVRSAIPTCPRGEATLPALANVRTYRPVHPACSGYHVLHSVTRHVGTRRVAAVVQSASAGWYSCTDQTGSSTTSPDWRGGGWYRYQGEAGTQIPTYPPGYLQCGTYSAGWMEGGHPTVGQGEVTRTVYFQYGRNTKHLSLIHI